MGAWGPGISSNDTFADTYGIFFSLYDEGRTVGEITSNLISHCKDTIDDPDESNNFWFALAKAQWECKELDPDVFQRVAEIIECGTDIEVWRRLDADQKTLTQRKAVLLKFLATLRTERKKARARKKKIIRQPPFDKGDCLTFKLADGNYGGAVVLEAERDTEFGYCLIATTRINQPHKPAKSDFETAEILSLNYLTWEDDPCIFWYLPLRYKKIAHLIEKVESIDVQNQYCTKNSKLKLMGDFETWIIQVTNMQFESEKTKPRSLKRQTIKEMAG